MARRINLWGAKAGKSLTPAGNKSAIMARQEAAGKTVSRTLVKSPNTARPVMSNPTAIKAANAVRTTATAAKRAVATPVKGTIQVGKGESVRPIGTVAAKPIPDSYKAAVTKIAKPAASTTAGKIQVGAGESVRPISSGTAVARTNPAGKVMPAQAVAKGLQKKIKK